MKIRKWVSRCSGILFLMSLLSGCGMDSVEEVRTAEAGSESIVISESSIQELPEAPYLSYLDVYWETGLSVDMKLAEDMGAYYIVPGVISHPISFSEDQCLAMENGQEIEVVVNEVSGETKMLRKAAASEYGPTYFLYEKGSEPDEYDRGVYASFDTQNGVYTLWRDSADTLMKVVYEGDVYILKGAVTGAHVSVEDASKNQTEIVIPAQDAKEWEGLVSGNHLYHDGRGYFSAVYALGD